MKILFLADGIFPVTVGGMERHSRGFVEYMTSNDVEVDVVHIVQDESQLEELELRNNPTVYEFVLPSSDRLPGHYVRSYKKLSKKLYRLFKTGLSTYDLVYAKGLLANAFLSNVEEVPVVVNLHGYETIQPSFGFVERLQKSMLKRAVTRQIKHADYVVSYGAKITELLRSCGVDENRILEISGAIDSSWLKSESELGSGSDELQLLFFGRQEIRKGYQVLETALEGLANVRLGVIGREGKSDDVTLFHGQVIEKSKIQTIMAKADVLVLPSLSEGMPNVILEAMASGLAIIASDVGAVSLMVDESNGRLVEPNNSLELRRAIEDVQALSKDKLKEMQACSLEKVKKHFLWENVARKTIEKFEGITR